MPSPTFFAFLIFVYVAVLCKNWTLFHCVFRSHYHFWRAVTYYFRYRWGSYALWILDTFTQHYRIMCCEFTGLCKFLRRLHWTFIHGSATYKLRIVPLCISIPSPCLKCCIAELPLRMGLIRKLNRYLRIYEARMSPLWFSNMALQSSQAIKTCDGILFDFYTGLPHIAVDLCIYIASFPGSPC